MKLALFGAALPIFLTAGAHTASAKPRSWVALSARTSAAQYVTGAPIDVTLIAKNTRSRDAFLRFSSGQRFDVQLFKPGAKTPVYTWSATKMFSQMVGQVRLRPGQSTSFPAQIGDEQGALVPGKYLLRAFLTNSSGIEAPPVPIEVVPSPLQLQVSPVKTSYKRGEPVSFLLHATNTSKKAQEIQFSSGQRFDVSVADEAGNIVWSWAANKRFTDARGTLSLAPGESKTFEADWNGEALPDAEIAPGTYLVRAVLTGNPPLQAAPIQIEIQ